MMTLLYALAVAIAGGIGAALRFVVDGIVRQHTSGGFPMATMVVNVSGSLILGLLTGLALAGLLPAPWPAVVGTGLLGGYTTFSTASVETVRLAEQGRRLAALVNGVGMLLLCVLVAAAGYLVGRSV